MVEKVVAAIKGSLRKDLKLYKQFGGIVYGKKSGLCKSK